MFKRKRYNLKLRVQRDEKNIIEIRHFGLKKITYNYDSAAKKLKATLVYEDGKKKIVEYVNVMEVEKEEV